MTLTLILVRHAKSDHPSGTADHDRPLTDRGRKGAASIGRWLAAEGLVPDEVLCSTAARVQQTWEALRDAARWEAEARADRRLYNAPPGAIREAVAGASGRSVLLIAHNPGIGEAAADLARAAPSHPRFYDYPTASTTVLRFDAEDWAAAVRGKGEVAAFAVPGDL